MHAMWLLVVSSCEEEYSCLSKEQWVKPLEQLEHETLGFSSRGSHITRPPQQPQQ
jgi:hypothetical protein